MIPFLQHACIEKKKAEVFLCVESEGQTACLYNIREPLWKQRTQLALLTESCLSTD